MHLRIVFIAAAATALAGASCTAPCTPGAEGCPCNASGGCDPGLSCFSKRCVDPYWTPDGGGSSLLADGGRKPPPPPSCTRNADCAAGEVCTFDDTGRSACVKGSGKACDASGNCVNQMRFDRHEIGQETSMRGRTCTTSNDCPVLRGHVLGVCVDADGSGTNRTCVPLCQYHDDPSLLSCATDPRFGLITGCARNHARAHSTIKTIYYCSSIAVTGAWCRASTAPFDADLEWTVDCIEDHHDWGTSSCGAITVIGPSSCFLSQDRPDAKMSGPQFADAVRQHLTLTTASTGGSNSSPNQSCGADCDCGHCSYCDKSGSGAVCRYAGEGPYGCYRGCD